MTERTNTTEAELKAEHELNSAVIEYRDMQDRNDRPKGKFDGRGRFFLDS